MREIILSATVENIAKVTAFVDEQLEALSCPMKAQMQINVAIDELFGNIASYAYAPGTGGATVRFDFDAAARVVSITFLDSGVPFDPLSIADPNVSASAEERGVGGLGIYLVKKTMDKVDYRYEDGKNILTIQKHI